MSAENDSTKGPLSQFRSAKTYLDNNKVPQMFQSLIASLMLEKPENHFDFLDAKLEEIKEIGLDKVDWETFVYQLHPTRNTLRQEVIQDGKVYTKSSEPTENEFDSNAGSGCEGSGEGKEEDYKPELFLLTEAND